MQYSTVRQVFFSPAGTTRRVAEKLVHELTCGADTQRSPAIVVHDLLRHPVEDVVHCAPDELLVVSLPVFAGRIPSCSVASLERFKGSKSPAVAVVLYGNRAYDDALLELKNLLEENGFVVVAGGAFVGRHSIIQEVGVDRPDERDMEKVAAFAQGIREKKQRESVLVPGTMPYRERKPVLLLPSVEGTCTLCGACVEACPAQALRLDATRLVKDDARCVACTTCIQVCPEGVQGFRGSQFETFRAMFVKTFSERKEPEIFL